MRRELYGIAEIAESLGLTRQTVTVWRKRGSWAMPQPDAELASGPVWRSATIEPWINTSRARLAGDALPSGLPLQAGDVKRAGRRLFRLAALLLEEPVRPQLLSQARTDVLELARQIAHAPEDETRNRLQSVLGPLLIVGDPEFSDNEPDLTALARHLLHGLPMLVEALTPIVDPNWRRSE